MPLKPIKPVKDVIQWMATVQESQRYGMVSTAEGFVERTLGERFLSFSMLMIVPGS